MQDHFHENFMKRSWRGVPLLNEYCDALRIREKVRKAGQARGVSLDLRPTRQGKWIVFQRIGTKEHLVGMYDALDDRVVRRVEEVLDPKYSLSSVVERVDKEHDKVLQERTGAVVDPAVEELAFHTKRLTGHVDHVYFNRRDSSKLDAV